MAKLIILTGEIQSGKTTFLQKWLRDKQASGILSPIVTGKRMLFSIADNIHLPFQADTAMVSTISVGRHHFYKEAFDAANKILCERRKSDWLIIDEIGPLEVAEQGFFPSLNKILREPDRKILLVVRINLLKPVIEKFSLQQASIYTLEQLSKEETSENY